MKRRIINPWKWQDALGFVQANEVTDAKRMLVCSGQVPVDDDGVPMHAGDMGKQISAALDNLETVLGQAGFDLSQVVRLTLYTTDVDGFMVSSAKSMGRLVSAGCKPAMTLLGVTRLFHPGVLIEMEATAVA